MAPIFNTPKPKVEPPKMEAEPTPAQGEPTEPNQNGGDGVANSPKPEGKMDTDGWASNSASGYFRTKFTRFFQYNRDKSLEPNCSSKE